LMIYWQISPVFTHEVGLIIKFHVLTDSATWNPGNRIDKGFVSRAGYHILDIGGKSL